MKPQIHLKTKMLFTTLLFLAVNACATQPKKADIPIEKAPEGRVPHVPGLTSAQVKVLWVPEKIEENRWEEGHFMYVIERPSTWSVK
jgi:hypothetical protein